MGRRHIGYETLLARTRNNSVLQLEGEKKNTSWDKIPCSGMILRRDKQIFSDRLNTENTATLAVRHEASLRLMFQVSK